MKKTIHTLFLLFIWSLGYSQMDTTKWKIMSITATDTIWIEKPNVADIARDNGDFKTAILEYSKLIKTDPTQTKAYYDIACIYSFLKNKDSAFKYLIIALQSEDNARHVFTDPDFYNLIHDARWTALEDEQIKRTEEKKIIKYKDIAVTKELWHMAIKDQAYYFEITIAEKKHGMKSRQSDSLWKLKEKLNNENLTRIKQIIEKYGWPKVSEFGGRAGNTAFLVIQHADYEAQKKYLPLLEEACKVNEARWESYALMKDRMLTDEKKPQIYGSQVQYNNEKKVYELFALEDPANVDKRRATVGLGPLRDYVKQWNIEFNVPQNK